MSIKNFFKLKFIITYSIIFSPYDKIYAIDLLEAWEATKLHSKEYKVLYHEREIIRAQAKQEQSIIFPKLSVDINYQNNLNRNDQSPKTDINTNKENGWDIELSQALFNPSAWYQYIKAKISIQQSEIEFRKKEEELLSRLSKIYFNILTIKKNILLANLTKYTYSKQLEQARSMFRLGKLTIIDTYDVQSKIDAENIQITTLENELNIAEKEFKNLTGISNIDIKDLKRNKLYFKRNEDSLDFWLKLADDNNQEIKSLNLLIEREKNNIKSAKSSYFPTLTLTVGYQNKKHVQDNWLKKFGGNPYKENYQGAYISLNFNMIIYQGGVTFNKVREAIERLAQAKDSLDINKNKIHLMIEELFLRIKSAITKLHAQEKLLQTNFKKLEAVRLGLEYGENTSLDVFKAQQEIAEADKELTKIYYELFQSYIELIHLTGQFNNKKYISLIKNSFQ